ncbi:hypothetical protein HTZ77_02685 [Nonomuraea sp. SMC257]|uniref:Exo-alpha-sialidase n=1 Tax=Nonomuraea montanisoli TaxID=2741721 RepID=A0A7Y6I2M5_9ACTN|nr:hypothetical protein [Nonomuraea montanisoli]NUW30336.1 hypothetical protein [Nonomuraea montanisoli]
MRILRGRTMLIACVLAFASCAAEPSPVSAPPSSPGSPKTAASSAAAPQSSPTTSAVPAPGWQSVEPDDEQPDGIALSDVAATGPDKAWAVGKHADAEDESPSGVLLRVDGLRWRSEQGIEGRILGALSSDFRAVDADGSGNAWVVGSVDSEGEGNTSIDEVPLALRWNGQDWDIHTPFAESWDLSTSLEDRKDRWRTDRLADVAVDGRRAALIGLRGSQGAGATSSPVLLTWNGRRFSRREYQRGGRFNAVDAGAGHLWIVGMSSGGRCADSHPAIWHSASPGTAPTRMRLPGLGRGSLRHIWQNGPSDVWAVGETGTRRACDEYGRPGGPLVLHWDGASWKKIEMPRWKVNLRSVTAFATDDVWVAGVDHGEDERPTQVTLLHYDGRRWTRDHRDVGGEICGDGFTITRLPTTSRLLLAGRAHCGDDTKHVLQVRR